MALWIPFGAFIGPAEETGVSSRSIEALGSGWVAMTGGYGSARFAIAALNAPRDDWQSDGI